MRFNKITTLLILLFSLLIISNVIYASDIENNNITTETNQNSNYQTRSTDTYEEPNIITVKRDSDLQRGINTIKSSEKKYQIMNFKEGNYSLVNSLDTYQDTTPEKTIIINGNNSRIDGNNETQFAYIKKGYTLIINNLTIANMKDNIGGAIQNYGTIIINNCIFENNTSLLENGFGGGAIYNDGYLNITNTTFKSNTAYYSGSAIFSVSNSNNNTYININNCSFEDNNAIRNSTIELIYSETNIYNSTFNNNKAQFGSTICVNLATLNIQNTTIKNEKVSSIISNNAFLIINNSTISNNNITTSLICNMNLKSSNEPYIEINDTLFCNNTANDVCGVLNNYNDGPILINNSKFQNNTSLNNEGIIKDLHGKTIIINSIFLNNTSEDLFKGNTENFVNVINNKYEGNNLKSYLTLNYDSLNDNVRINGTIKTDEIYNTTVNLGQICIFQDENLLYDGNVNNSIFNISSSYDTNANLTLKLVYNGKNSFRNQLREVYVSSGNDEYLISLSNLTEYFMIGDIITYDIIIENIGDTVVRNINLQYLIPEELDFVNSSYYIENNILNIPELMINDVLTININTTPKFYENLSLEFNIFDVNNNSYTKFENNITFLDPSIRLNSINASIGDVINITANLINYHKSTIDEIIFYFNYKKVENLNVELNNNTIIILNYKIADNLLSKNYNIEMICSDNDFINSFSDKSQIRLSKLDTYSVMDIELVDNVFNLSARIFDTNNNLVNNGSVVIKINGHSVKSFKINNGEISIVDYKIDKKYQTDEYEILLVYTGNSKFNTHRNSTNTSFTKKAIDLNIDYEIKNDILRISANIIKNNYNLSENDAFIVFKVNGKSISSKILLTENDISYTYDIGKLSCINNITVSFYGNEYYYPNYLTLDVNI